MRAGFIEQSWNGNHATKISSLWGWQSVLLLVGYSLRWNPTRLVQPYRWTNSHIFMPSCVSDVEHKVESLQTSLRLAAIRRSERGASFVCTGESSSRAIGSSTSCLQSRDYGMVMYQLLVTCRAKYGPHDAESHHWSTIKVRARIAIDLTTACSEH
jgi:hypothetical protein